MERAAAKASSADRELRLSDLPGGSDSVTAGGPLFVAYCMGGEVRAELRRNSVQRAAALHRRRLNRGEDAYPTALLWSQRLAVALEDLARLVLALEDESADRFSILRDARIDGLDRAFERFDGDPAGFREAIRMPSTATADQEEPKLREALLGAADALVARWHGQWTRCAGGWLLLRRVAKALRHGAPLLPRELVLGPPGAGALGEGLSDKYSRWVLLTDTKLDFQAQHLQTEYSMADVSDVTLGRAHQAGLEAIALARQLASLHVHRVRSQSRWALPDEALRLVAADHQRVLRAGRRG